MTRLIVSLEEKGLVKRTAIDARTKNVKLTAKGVQLHEDYGPVLKKLAAKALAPISKKDIAIAHKALEALAKNISRSGREN